MPTLEEIYKVEIPVTTQGTIETPKKEVPLPVSHETVPVKSRWVAPRGLPKSKEYEQLREIARSRSGVVSAIPRQSESGQAGFTPHQQFVILVSALITSTFTTAYAIANLFA